MGNFQNKLLTIIFIGTHSTSCSTYYELYKCNNYNYILKLNIKYILKSGLMFDCFQYYLEWSAWKVM